MTSEPLERAIRCQVTVPAACAEVWRAWTTSEGIRTFFAPGGLVELRVGGPFEILFAPEAPVGQRGAEGMTIMAIQAPRMLAFTWNAPPHLAEVRGQLTHVQIRLLALDPSSTRVILTHGGWGEGGQWDEAFAYFQHAWGAVVLPRLRHRFAVGPVDWNSPPALDPA